MIPKKLFDTPDLTKLKITCNRCHRRPKVIEYARDWVSGHETLKVFCHGDRQDVPIVVDLTPDTVLEVFAAEPVCSI